MIHNHIFMNCIQKILSYYLLNAKKREKEYFNDIGLFKNKLIQTGDSSIHFYEHIPIKITSSTKCILLLHGNGEDRKEFLINYKIIKKINKDHIYIVPDYRGFGESTLSFDIEYVLKDLFALVYYINNIYKINRYVIIGQSFGATISLLLDNYINYRRRLQQNDKPKYKVFSNGLDYKYRFPNGSSEYKIKYEDQIEIEKTVAYSPFYSSMEIINDYTRRVLFIDTLREWFLRKNVSREIDLNFSRSKKENFSPNISIYVAKGDNVVNPSHSLLIRKQFDIQVFEVPDSGHISIFKNNNTFE